jgi:hypothetical protein
MKRSDFIKSISILGASALSFRLLSNAEAATSVLLVSSYPNPLPTTGSLELSNVLDYFKGALLESTDFSSRRVDYNPEYWPFNDNDRGFLDEAPNFPMSRGDFYDWIDYYTNDATITYAFGTIGGQKLYEIPNKAAGWPIRAVNDWARIKLLELMFFGDFGNGSDLSKISDVGSGTVWEVVPNCTRANMYLLRYGLLKFDTYGECHDDTPIKPPSPSNLTVNASLRSFDFTYAPGYTSPSLYEFSINGAGFTAVTSKPMDLSDYKMLIPAGGIALRVAASTVYEDSGNQIQSVSSVPAVPADLFVTLDNQITHFILEASVDEPLNTTIKITANVAVNSVLTTIDFYLSAGDLTATSEYHDPFTTVSLGSVFVSPTITNDGRSIVLNY